MYANCCTPAQLSAALRLPILLAERRRSLSFQYNIPVGNRGWPISYNCGAISRALNMNRNTRWCTAPHYFTRAAAKNRYARTLFEELHVYSETHALWVVRACEICRLAFCLRGLGGDIELIAIGLNTQKVSAPPAVAPQVSCLHQQCKCIYCALSAQTYLLLSMELAQCFHLSAKSWQIFLCALYKN